MEGRKLQVQIFRYVSSNKHLNFIRLRANSTVPTSRAAAAPKGKKRKEDEGEKGGGRGRALLTQSASSSSATNSASTATIAFDDASAQRSQLASQPARGAGVREERNADARQKYGAGKSEASVGDGRTNGREEGKSERRRRRRWGTERTHLLSPPLLAVLSSASQTSSVTPPLLLDFCSIFRVLAEWGPGKGSDGRASGRTRERTSGRGRRECEEQDPQRVPNSQQPPRRTSGQKQVAPTDGDFYRKQIVLGPDNKSLKGPLDQPGQA